MLLSSYIGSDSIKFTQRRSSLAVSLAPRSVDSPVGCLRVRGRFHPLVPRSRNPLHSGGVSWQPWRTKPSVTETQAMRFCSPVTPVCWWEAIAGNFIGDDTTYRIPGQIPRSRRINRCPCGRRYLHLSRANAPAYLTQGIIAELAAGWYTAFDSPEKRVRKRVRSNVSPHRLAAMKTPDGNWLLAGLNLF